MTEFPEQGIVFEVEDHGCGISFEQWERIFEPFYRLANDANRGKAGTGLGLTVVKRFVQVHRGKVWLES